MSYAWLIIKSVRNNINVAVYMQAGLIVSIYWIKKVSEFNSYQYYSLCDCNSEKQLK